MSASERPRRYLAAWGDKYDDGAAGVEVEIDVFTVNSVEADERDAEARAREAFSGRVESIIDAYGDVARVEYAGTAGDGYRYISEDRPASQQAFAGAKRAAGGDRSEAGTFGQGFSEPEDAPDLADCVARGVEHVIPAVESHFRELGERLDLTRDSNREEDGEEVGDRPTDGLENVVRVDPGGGTFTYTVTDAGEVVEK